MRELLHTPQTLYTAGILLILSISALISGSFWGIIVTEKLNIPAQNLAIFPFIKSTVRLLFFFVVMPQINKMHFKLPMVYGFLGFIASQLLLITAPQHSYFLLILNVFLEAFCFATIRPLVDRLAVLTIDARERARILSILNVGIILLTSPFGWIAGTLSDIDKGLPFILNSPCSLRELCSLTWQGRIRKKDSQPYNSHHNWLVSCASRCPPGHYSGLCNRQSQVMLQVCDKPGHQC